MIIVALASLSIALIGLGLFVYLLVAKRNVQCFFTHKWRKQFEIVDGQLVGARICCKCRTEQFKIGNQGWKSV